MSNFVNLLSNVLMPAQVSTRSGEIKRASSGSSYSNPFASNNPFVNSNHDNPFATYGQNRPVLGGYFAGYYNNQPNIVGRRLFIEA